VRALVAAVVFLSVIAAVAYLIVRSVPSTQREIEAAYARLDSAVRSGDVNALMAELAPDYHEQRTMQGRLLSRSDAEALYRRAFKDWDHVHNQKADIYRMAVRGNSANVVVERTLSGKVTDSGGLYGPKGKVHDATLVTMEVDSWTKTPTGWLMNMRSIASIDLLIDKQHMHSGVTEHHHDD